MLLLVIKVEMAKGNRDWQEKQIKANWEHFLPQIENTAGHKYKEWGEIRELCGTTGQSYLLNNNRGHDDDDVS